MHTPSLPLGNDYRHPAAPSSIETTPQSGRPFVSNTDATAMHHAQLVAHYWHFAQQGVLAPVIEGDLYQWRAREEALEWAQRHGIVLSHPENSPIPATVHGGAASVSTPTHHMPTSPAAPLPDAGPRSGRPLPTPKPNPPVPLAPSVFSLSDSNRPAPSSTSSVLPAVFVEGNECVSTPSAALLTAFPVDEASPSQADDTRGVPTFTMILEDARPELRSAVNLATTVDSKTLTSPLPPLHPRFDPSHPSHYLYHPSSSAPALFDNDNVTCHGCDATILGRKLLAMGKQWHPECFVCSLEGCGQRLEHVEFDGKDDRVYCILHFEELFADICYHCKTPITIDQVITIDDPRLLPPTRRTYHALHLFCSSCGDPFIEPKLLLPDKDEATPDPYTIHEGFVYCENCDLRLWKPKCASAKCGHSGIANGWIEIGDQKWHEECFCCKMCDTPLTGSYMVPEGGQNEVLCLACFDG